MNGGLGQGHDSGDSSNNACRSTSGFKVALSSSAGASSRVRKSNGLAARTPLSLKRNLGEPEVALKDGEIPQIDVAVAVVIRNHE